MTADSRAFRRALLAFAAVGVSACGGSGSSVSSGPPPPPPPPPAANLTAMVVDAGPVDSSGNPLGHTNQAYVTITVCAPGSTTNCQSIDHIWVDTGSTGLRLFPSTLTSSLPLSPDASSGNPIANCIQFVLGFAWGAVRTADVKIGGESASALPIQVIGDTAGNAIPAPASAPTSCSSPGGTLSPGLNTVKDMGANGLLGIGVFTTDCPAFINCATSPPQAPPAGFYYTCPGGACSPVGVPTKQQLQNVVALFPTDNNGTLIQLQSIPTGGATTASGSLIFGINTQSNNQLGNAFVFVAWPDVNTAGTIPGDIQTTTTYGDMKEPASFIDSGSNGWYFNDPSIMACTQTNLKGFYCPSNPVTRTATMLPYNTPTNTISHTYTFTIADANTLAGNAYNDLGGSGQTCNNTTMPCSFDWGLPFFYGRSVFTAMEGSTTIGGNNPPFYATTP
jgi:hypothetical protein